MHEEDREELADIMLKFWEWCSAREIPFAPALAESVSAYMERTAETRDNEQTFSLGRPAKWERRYKFSVTDVREVNRRLAAGERVAAIAQDYHVSPQRIYELRRIARQRRGHAA